MFTVSAKMVALPVTMKTQKARKLLLQISAEISYIMDKILEMKMQWNLTDNPVPSQVNIRWDLCASKKEFF